MEDCTIGAQSIQTIQDTQDVQDMKGLKGISVWIWVVGSLVIGLILLTVFVQFLSYITKSREIEIAKSSFQTLSGDARSLCQTIAGAAPSKIEKPYTFPDAVSDIYSVSSTSNSFDIPSGVRSYGRYLCMKVYDEISCENIQCDVEMSSIKNTPSLITTINNILGRVGSKEYTLDIIKSDCGVSILKFQETPGNLCAGKCDNVVSLAKCQDHNVISLIGESTLVMTDFTPIFDCCNNYPNTVTFLKNVAKFFGGTDIMIVWESASTNPESDKYATINDALNSEGFTITSFRHKEKLTATDLEGKSQLWIYLPGYCSEQPELQKTAECTEFTSWGQSEYDLIKNFVDSGGKLFIITDYSSADSPFTKQTIVNNILVDLGYNARVMETKVCIPQGNNGENIVKTTDITSHEITQNINEFDFLASSEIVC